MKNQKVSTALGTIVIVIFTITAGAFVWQVVKNREVAEVPQSVINVKKPVATQTPSTNQQNQTQETPSNNKTTNPASVVVQPKMPTLDEEANKSPEELVKDFYNWYIGNTNYSYYKIEQLKETGDPVIPKMLVLKSPFISSTYEKNMNKTNGGDPILCSQEPDNNKFKGIEDPVISSNNARMYARIEYASNPDINFKTQVMLKKERGQWKIDEINCGQFRL